MIIPITPFNAPIPAAVAKNCTNCWQINLTEAAGITRKPLTSKILKLLLKIAKRIINR
jgi:hypothetical protein